MTRSVKSTMVALALVLTGGWALALDDMGEAGGASGWTAQHLANTTPSFAEEMHGVKQAYLRFLAARATPTASAQGQDVNTAPTFEEEMRGVKRDFLRYYLAQARTRRLAEAGE